jgi:hypothetical protein
LAAGQYAAVFAGDLGKQRDRFVDRLRRVIAKRRGFHRADFIGWFRWDDWFMFLIDARFSAQSQNS